VKVCLCPPPKLPPQEEEEASLFARCLRRLLTAKASHVASLARARASRARRQREKTLTEKARERTGVARVNAPRTLEDMTVVPLAPRASTSRRALSHRPRTPKPARARVVNGP